VSGDIRKGSQATRCAESLLKQADVFEGNKETKLHFTFEQPIEIALLPEQDGRWRNQTATPTENSQ